MIMKSIFIASAFVLLVKSMLRKHIPMCKQCLWGFLFILLPIGLAAQSFTYNYRGINFKCKIKDGKVVIRSFDNDAREVVIPSQVKDNRGLNHPVYKVDLYAEATIYKTNTIAIEPGITEIAENCFFCFEKLSMIYIPNTIEKIGKRAFNRKYAPDFRMPSNIPKWALLAGNVVYPNVQPDPKIDPLAELDYTVYGEVSEMNDTVIDNQLAVQKTISITPGTSDIDYNIPTMNVKRENTFCVIIANENYRQKDTPNVKYAEQDGKTFQNYCLRTLGIPRENVRFASNATFLQMKSLLGWLQQIGEVYGKDANFVVYYAGHGVPDEKGNCKLIPSDVSINDVNNSYSLTELYATLGQLTTNNVLVLIDACFSGNDREDLAAVDDAHRGIVREVKTEKVSGNVVVLTAASGAETALSYDEKAHGLFSYYLMKKLQDTKGDVTYGDLYDYIKKEVMRKSIVAKGKKQTPSVIFSDNMTNNWKNLKF